MIGFPDPFDGPNASVRDVAQASAALARTRLLLTWLGGLYFLGVGAAHFGEYAAGLYRARAMLSWLLPWWAYVVGFILPVARVGAGISFIRGSRLSPVFLLVVTVYRAVFPIVWYRFWVSRTGRPIPEGPMPFAVIVDVVLMAVITGYAFLLKRRGTLK